MYRYRMIRTNGVSLDIGSFESFGIQATSDTSDDVLATVSDVSPDGESVRRIVDLCNQLQLDPIHLLDVVEDALAGH